MQNEEEKGITGNKDLTIGQAIALKRKKFGIKASELADILDIDPRTLYNIENDLFMPSIINLEKIFKALSLKLYVGNSSAIEISTYKKENPDAFVITKQGIEKYRKKKKRISAQKREAEKIKKAAELLLKEKEELLNNTVERRRKED